VPLRQQINDAVGKGLSRIGYELVPTAGRWRTRYPDLEPEFAELCEQCRPYTATSVERMYGLYQAVRHVAATGLEGDFVETGVWRGGSSMLAALTLARAGAQPRRLWLYDTFEGMPEPSQHDVDHTGRSAATEWEQHPGHLSDDISCEASREQVEQALVGAGLDLDQFAFVKGKVQDTIPAQAPERISLLRLDTDWYESTRHELEHLYPRLVPGGVLLLDDYGHWEGSRRAVDEYFAAEGRTRPLLTRLDYSGRIAIKTAD
jgi:hypothetical protein